MAMVYAATIVAQETQSDSSEFSVFDNASRFIQASTSKTSPPTTPGTPETAEASNSVVILETEPAVPVQPKVAVESAVTPEPLTSQPDLPPTNELESEVASDPNAPIIIHCDEEYCRNFCTPESSQNVEQCVIVKKSILGCMEGITILPQDEVWLIDARDSLCGETDLSLLQVSQIIGSDLVPRELADLTNAHASGDEYATMLYIHGNQTNKEFAIARGLQVYRNAIATKSYSHGPVRYVIWAWKSEQEKVRFYPDYVVKSDRSVQIGETFAATLNQFSDRNMVVFGFSLGVQVILSAFDSPSLDMREGDPTRYQVAFAAPAINPEFVACNLLKTDCVSPAQQALVFTNRKDRAIRTARAIVRRRNPGKESTIIGLAEAGKLNLGSITSIDVFEESGRFHSIERYTRSGTLQSMMANLLNEVSANRAQMVQPMIFLDSSPQAVSEFQSSEFGPVEPAESVPVDSLPVEPLLDQSLSVESADNVVEAPVSKN